MKKLINLYPLWIFLFTTLGVFRLFIFNHLLPIPSDILVGAYYPWLDYKWGYVIAVPIKNSMPSDVISLLYPWRTLGISMMKSGTLPLWDPTALLGTPLLANFQAALLNPFNILYGFFRVPIAWSIEIVLQPFLIALTTYLFLRNLKLEKLAAVFGGLAFAFCGFSIVWMEYGTIGYTIAFIPVLFLLIDKLVKTPKLIYSCMFAIFLSIQIFCGYPQISIYTLIFVTLYFAYRIYFERNNFLRKTLFLGLGIVGGLAIGAVQLLPSLELLHYSIRTVDNTAFNGGIQFLPLSHLITFLTPDFFGNPGTGNFWGEGSYDNFAFSIPIAAVFFILLGSIKKFLSKENAIFILFGLFSLVLALSNPISNLVTNYFSPLEGAVSSRVLMILDFASIVLSSISFDSYLKGERRQLFQRYVLLLGMMFIVGTLFVLNRTTHSSDLSIALRNSIVPLALVFLLTIFVSVKKKVLFKFAVGGIFICLLADIFFATNKYLSFTPESFLYPKTEVTNFLTANTEFDRFDKEKTNLFSANTWIPYGLKTASGQNALYPIWISKYLSIVNSRPMDYSGRFVDLTHLENPLLNTLDIKYFVILKNSNIEKMNLQLEDVYEYGNVKILQNKKNLGMSWFAKETICNQDDSRVLSMIEKTDYSPKDIVYVNCSAGNHISGSNDTVVTISDAPNQSIFETNTGGENTLIISKAFYPGWNVYIDNQKSELLKANTALTAVDVPAGKHVIDLKYEPESFALGLKISVVSLLICVLSLLMIKIRNEVRR